MRQLATIHFDYGTGSAALRRQIDNSKPLVHGLAAIVDAGRARFPALGERLEKIGELGVPVLRHEPREVSSASL
jgi:hypothetical protein